MLGLRIGKLTLAISFLIGCGPSTSYADANNQTAQAQGQQVQVVIPPRGYHLGDVEAANGIFSEKPAALLRHLIYNFQNPGFHNPATFVETAADQIMALQVAANPQLADPQAYEATKQVVLQKMAAFNEVDSTGKTPAQNLSTLYLTLYIGFNTALAPQVDLSTPVYEKGQLTGFLDKDGNVQKPDGPMALAVDAYTEPQRLFRMMLFVSRTFPNEFFAELRKHEPVFTIPGDNPESEEFKNQQAKGIKLSRPVEKATHIVTRFEAISEGFAYNNEDYGDNWAPVKVKRATPPWTDVIYSRGVFYFGSLLEFTGKIVKLMDYATGAYLTENLEWDIEGTFMLGTKGTKVNEEKSYMHLIANRVQDMNSPDGTLADRETSMEKVREVVAWYVKDAMKSKGGANSVDFARDISRQAALGMVSDYFGFFPPDVNTQTNWSRNTQNSFFHNIFDDPWLDHMNLKSGEEMADYISEVLLPTYRAQLANGHRPANDTVSMMMRAHAKIPEFVKVIEHRKLNDRRIMATTMGLLVGAGETTTMAANFSLHEIMVQAAKYAAVAKKKMEADPTLQIDPLAWWKEFITTAKMAAAGDKAAKAKFDAYVWEALRFKPVNPWTEREADINTGALVTYLEDASQPGANGKAFEYQFNKGDRVLFATQSAMFDPAMKLISGEQVPTEEKNPWAFSLNRGNGNYIHLSFGYHRCLGDDVAQAMIPEIILQTVANVDNLNFAASLASVDKPGNANTIDRDLMFTNQSVPVEPSFAQYIEATGGPGALAGLKKSLASTRTPFPETFTLVYGSKSEAVAREISPYAEAREYLKKLATEEFEDLGAVVEYLENNEQINEGDLYSQRVLNNGLARFDIEAFKANAETLMDVEIQMQNSDVMGTKTACQAMQVDDFGDEGSTEDRICTYRTMLKAFNICYFLQRTGGQLSSKNAFNKCAYEKDKKGQDRFPSKDWLNQYLKEVRGKGDFYWVKFQVSEK